WYTPLPPMRNPAHTHGEVCPPVPLDSIDIQRTTGQPVSGQGCSSEQSTVQFRSTIMKQQLVVIGAGFAGLWSALSAARLFDMHDRQDVEITVLAPQAELRIRPRFYEADVHSMFAPLQALFD